MNITQNYNRKAAIPRSKLTWTSTPRHQNRRLNRDTDAIKDQESSNDNDSMRPNIGDEFGSPVPLRPQSAPGPTTVTGKEINVIKDLQLSQDQGTTVGNAGQSVVQSPINPLTPASRRCDMQHKITFNPSYNNVDQLKKSDKSPVQPIKVDNNQAAPSDKNDTVPSYIDTDAEPESDLLLQPKTRPISHEQLVVEIKDIYADLIMVKAKCIDVDEKQFTKTQEKISSRQIKLSNEQ